MIGPRVICYVSSSSYCFLCCLVLLALSLSLSFTRLSLLKDPVAAVVRLLSRARLRGGARRARGFSLPFEAGDTVRFLVSDTRVLVFMPQTRSVSSGVDL